VNFIGIVIVKERLFGKINGLLKCSKFQAQQHLLYYIFLYHGLGTKCKKPDNKAKTFQINFLNDEISQLTSMISQ
jgi:hypothetical protein